MTLHIRSQAAFRPSTVNLEDGTVEVILTTGAAVRRNGYVERLDLRGADLSRLRGAPFLDGHRQGGTDDILGVIEEVELRPEGLWALVRFRPSKLSVLQDIKDGLIRGVSIGYSVEKFRETREGGVLVRTAIAWTPIEGSAVPVPAESGGAHFRSNNGGPDMAEETTTAPAPAPAEAEAQTRAEVNAEIRSMVEGAGLPHQYADALIDGGATIEEARPAILAAKRHHSKLTQIRTARAEIGVDHTDPAVNTRREGEALWRRAAGRTEEVSPEARGYMYRSVRDIAADCMRRSGQPVAGLSENELVTRALHTTSDFAAILGDAMGRELRAGYNAPTGGVRQLARQSSSRYLLRDKEVLRLGELDTLKKVNEHGEFRSGTLAETVERYMVETFGRIVGLSRQFIVNDDLGAQVQAMGRLGRAARAFEHQQLVGKLEANPLMSDGVAVFDAGAHGNAKAAAGATLADIKADLSAARLAMRKQTAVGGALIDVAPRFVLVPPDLETIMEEALTAVQATSTAEVNVFSALSLVVEPRLTSASRWYVVADPAQVDGLEYAYLEGAPGPQMETRVGFEVDGVQFRIRLDFGCGWTDHRGWFRVGA